MNGSKQQIDVEAIETSFALIAPQEEQLVERFYAELFIRFPAYSGNHARCISEFHRAYSRVPNARPNDPSTT